MYFIKLFYTRLLIKMFDTYTLSTINTYFRYHIIKRIHYKNMKKNKEIGFKYNQLTCCIKYL